MEASYNNNSELTSIELDNLCTFEELYDKVNSALAHLMWNFYETENVGITKLVGEPLATIQILMSQQLKNK